MRTCSNMFVIIAMETSRPTIRLTIPGYNPVSGSRNRVLYFSDTRSVLSSKVNNWKDVNTNISSTHYDFAFSRKHINGWVQERRNSSALAMELRLSFTNLSIYAFAFGINSLTMKYCRGLLYFQIKWLIAGWISNHMPSKVWNEITYPFPNFNSCTIEVWEWISNFIPHIIMDVITYPCWDY